MGFFFHRTNSPLCLTQMLPHTTLLSASSVNQVDNGVPNVPGEAVLSDTDVSLGQVDVEGGLFQDGGFPCLLLAKDWNTAGPEYGVIKPHQLHLGEICTERAAAQATAPPPGLTTAMLDPWNSHTAPRRLILMAVTVVFRFTPTQQCPSVVRQGVANRNGDKPHRNTSS